MSDEVKRGPGRPPKVQRLIPPNESEAVVLLREIADNHNPNRAEPILSAQFKEAVRLGVSGQIETSATTGNKGVASIAADWNRRVLTVITRDAQKRECTDYVPLESVKSMRPMPAPKAEAVA